MRKEAATIGGSKVLDYDGGAEFWVEDIEDWKAAIAAEGGLLTLVGECLLPIACPGCPFESGRC